jgi:nucleoside-diphosphate-sugar epimerase
LTHNVLVTHADEPIGRRIVKTLYHDERVEQIFAVGSGPPPRAFDSFVSGPEQRVSYARLDLAKHRPVSDLFHSPRFRAAEIDTLVHVPRHSAVSSGNEPIVAGLPARTAETRLVLQYALEAPSVENLVVLGSAFVYRLPPGNANRLSEDSELNLDPNLPVEIRSWIDCDMLIHGEVHNDRLRVALLRVPTVVAEGGYLYLNPAFGAGSTRTLRSLGFDPLCALVSDKDVARAIRSAVQSNRSGIYNIAGAEAVPFSVLASWTHHSTLPVPGPVLSWLSLGAKLLGYEESPIQGPHLRYGFTLDTERAVRELGFRPSSRIGLARAGDGRLQVETTSL